MTTPAKGLCCVLAAAFFVTACRASIGTDVADDVSNPKNPELRSVCVGDKDIRNSAAKLKAELKGCVVVEGFLRVVLIENAKQEDFQRLSFPQLREVTGYLLFFRVNGLLSLGQLFPNLTLIRGNELFIDKYALVVSELPQLLELGLTALQLVMRGSVRVQSNPELCLAESVDWSVLAPASSDSDNVFTKNNEHCRPCDCPSGLCWGYGQCRVRAAKKAPSGRDCHPNCAVGCHGTTDRDCTACLGPELAGRCISRCPGQTVLFRGRRCVHADWCVEEHPSAGGHNYAGGIVIKSSSTMASRVCVNECPSGYFEVDELVAATKRVRRKCEPCKGPCKKVCDPASVRSISNARNLKGCTIINGSLEIEIHSGHTEEVERELTVALGQVQVIMGSLVVSRSRPLTSLHFFRSLRLINNTDPGRSVAIFVNDNANLQYLFDWGDSSKTTSLAIGPGTKEASFFYNPRLCPEEIDKFAKVVEVADMFNSYNGFTNACGKRPHMSSTVSRLETESVVLTWPAWQPANEVMEYAIFVARAAARNVTEYSGTAQCDEGDPGNVAGDASLDGWAVHDVRFDKGNSEGEVSQLVPRLQPATLYAFYIKTYTKESKVNSPIKYFRTRPDRPTPPAAARAVAVRPSSSSSSSSSSSTASSTAAPTTPAHGTGTLLVVWEPPPRANGRLSHYIVVGELRDDDDRRQLGDKDFCELPSAAGGAVHESLTPDAAHRWLQGDATDADSSEGCCCLGCCRVPLDEDQCERLLRGRDVQDACGRPVVSLDRCAHVLYSVMADNLRVEDSEQNFPKTAKSRTPALDLSEQWDVEGVSKRRFVRIESASASSTLVESLVPFGLYSVRVHACGHEDSDDPGNGASPLATLCGAPALAAARTLPAPDVDLVVAPNGTLESTLEGDVLHVSWAEPPRPNGLVLAYHVRYRDRHRYEADEKCITRQSYLQKKGTVQILLKSMFPDHSAHRSPPGPDAERYAVQVRAVSLAGLGGWVDVKVRTAAEGGGSARESATAAPAEDTVSPKTTAAVVVVTLLLVLLAGALLLRHRAAGGSLSSLMALVGLSSRADSGRQRLVNPDLTDCWDLPDLPDLPDAEPDPWPDRPAATRVRYQREADGADADRVTIASTRTARAAARGRGGDDNGDWHWVTWPSDPDVHHPSLPPSPQRKDVVDTRLPCADSAEPARWHQGWHPTNPFHPSNSSWEDDGTQGEQGELHPSPLASRNPFLHSDARGSFEDEAVLTFVGDSVGELSTPERGRRGAPTRQQEAGPEHADNMFVETEIPAQDDHLDDEVREGSTIEEMHKSCSTDSFISVNLNGSDQAAGQSFLLKSFHNKDQQ